MECQFNRFHPIIILQIVHEVDQACVGTHDHMGSFVNLNGPKFACVVLVTNDGKRKRDCPAIFVRECHFAFLCLFRCRHVMFPRCFVFPLDIFYNTKSSYASKKQKKTMFSPIMSHASQASDNGVR